MKKLFTNDIFYLVVTIMGFIGSIVFSIGCLAFWSSVLEFSYVSSAIITLVNGVSVLVLYIAYKKHCKNLMKSLLGALLMGYFACMCTLTFPLVITFPLDMICMFILLTLSFIVLVNHCIINSDHKSRQVNVLVNQICTVAASIVSIVWVVCWIPHLDGLAIAFQIVSIIGVACLIIAVVCVESRLDTYRIDREVSGWTEKTGYPEGYVHEYEKRDNK